MSGDGRYMLTGEAGPLPRARVWDPVTGKEVAVLPLAHRGDIKLVAFAKNGKQVRRTLKRASQASTVSAIRSSVKSASTHYD